MPERRSVDSPVIAAVSAPMPAAASSTIGQDMVSPSTAAVYAPKPKNATVASEM